MIHNPYVQRFRKHFYRIPRALEGIPLGEGDEAVPQVGTYPEGDWTSIVDLIRQLPYLHHLNIFVSHGGPVELFEALSQYHPTCRVSIFTVWSFLPGGDPAYSNIPKFWVNSPMLYAVHVTTFENPNVDSMRFIEHPDRLLQSIALQAPNIKEMAMQILPFVQPRPKPGFNQSIQVDSQAKSGWPPGPAKLQTLSWPLNSKMTAEQFLDWQKITDFSLLKSWTIGCIEDSALLQTIVNTHHFQQLTRLTLALFQPMEDPGFWGAAELMFKSLPPLSYLCLLGTYIPEFLIGPVLYTHGPTLIELKLHKGSHRWASQDLRRLSKKGHIGPIFSSNDILDLAGQCLSLRKLRICVQRYQGLEMEDIWTSLGRFPFLTRLDLVLNCLPQMGANNMPVPPRELSDFEKSLIMDSSNNECPKWFIRDCMINCTISENLAKAFFTHILACQNAKRLTQLVIHPLFGQLNQYSCYAAAATRTFIDQRFFRNLALTWTIQREFRTLLHATSETFPDGTESQDQFPNETLSIFQSI
ncbi:hypothetical protein N7490_000011 [Penicillium lividum]|nr:hypothetical protein N7490_000011 [Penicillium lividum]